MVFIVSAHILCCLSATLTTSDIAMTFSTKVGAAENVTTTFAVPDALTVGTKSLSSLRKLWQLTISFLSR